MVAALAQVEGGDHTVGIAGLRAALSRSDTFGEPALRVATRIAFARSLRMFEPSEAATIVGDAERGLREALDILKDQPGPELGEVYAELSELLSRRGLAEEALSYSRRAFELSRR